MTNQNLRTMKPGKQELYDQLQELARVNWDGANKAIDIDKSTMTEDEVAEIGKIISSLQAFAADYDRQAGEIYNDPASWDVPAETEKRRVIIPARENHDGLASMIVTLEWICPKCGQPRGETFAGRSYDGSRILDVSCWNNPCGHVDKYSDVRKEAQENGLN